MSQCHEEPEEHGSSLDRREALMLLGTGLGLAAFAGCSSRSITRRLPGPDWPTPTSADLPNARNPKVPTAPSKFPNVQNRLTWTRSTPNYNNMLKMSPPKWVTVHHDGMTVFTSASVSAARDRLEMIRTAHRRDNGWADIGYHYAIDPAGRIHACRPVQWQGAHVKNCNPGNIGIVLLGNYELQRPSQVQLAALKVHVTQLRRAYSIPRGKVRGHKDWPSASTQCPGRYLHSQLRKV